MRYIVLIAISFVLNMGYAQSKRYNVFSLEAGGGLHVPFSPKDKVDRSNYISVSQFQLSGRYMFNEKFGLKGQYAYHLFKDKDNSQNKSQMNKLTLEAVYNLGKALNLHYTIQEDFVFLAHAGFGLSISTPQNASKYERMGNFQFGLTTMTKVSEKVAFYLDATPVVNFKQHYSYGGELYNPEYKHKSGMFLTVSAGFVFYIGDKRYHADWY